MNLFFKSFVFSLALIVANFSVINSPVGAEAVILKGTAYKSGITYKTLTVGVSELLVTNESIKRVAVTDPSVLDIKIVSDTSALLRGKAIGRTSMLIWEGKDETRPQKFQLTVKRDLNDLIASLKALDPSINVDYVLVGSKSINSSNGGTNSGAYTTAFGVSPRTVGEPAPSVVVDQSKDAKSGGGGSSEAQAEDEKIILTGTVKSGEVIAKALMIAMAYMGEQNGNLEIMTREGGLLTSGLEGILNPSGGSMDGNNLSSQLQFSSNLKTNLSNGAIIKSSSGKVVSMLRIEDKVQVAVKVRFYEVKKSNSKTFESGVTYQDNQAQYGGVPIANWIQSTAAITNGAGGVWALFPKIDVLTYVKALEANGSAKVLAEPTMVVMNGEPGQFRVGGEIPVIETSTTNNTTQSHIRYIDYGISLNILPSITESDSILMNVGAQTRDIDDAYSTTGTSSVYGFKTRKISTQVEMDPSQALIIGGLINAGSAQQLSKFPILGDIPILGALMRSKEFVKDESELILILSPEIVRAGNYTQMNKPLALEGQISDNNYYLLPDGSQMGQRTSLHINPSVLVPPQNGPVDLRRPATMTDLDNVYR